ncbi:5264_t:CDS:1 [Entrophospora sp. SA101]|nr:3638_t:CDS:1 [Entrophospora sp. SA101]CAJ0747322.1 5264_t:CDS:1 [Entrophospora sp. SA101]CAJ0843371.1 3060_t:CDS:1 [Entrophospora sp. SA101]CAJ0923633.1 4914_t:CDS:1 [Entrophospora sp. SA101]
MANNLIIKSFIFLFITIQIITSIPAVNADFSPLGKSLPFSIGNDLIGIYNQDNSNGGGYHQAKVYFKTTVPSINPDQTDSVKDIKCDTSAKTITLTLADKASLKTIDNWPDNVILMISHKHECFGKYTTQYYFVGNQTIDEPNLSAKFTTQPCDPKAWSSEFSFDLQWINGGTTPQRRNLYGKRIPFNKKRSDRLINKRIAADKSLKLDLNVLFDETTGKSSKPNFPILSSSQNNTAESLVCADCYVNGEATLFMHISGKGLKINEARVGINGNIKLNVDLGLNGQVSVSLNSPDLQIFDIPLSPLGIPNIFNIGPSILLAASAQVSTSVKGTLTTGGELSMPDFKAELNFDDFKNPKSSKSGFDIQSKSHDSKFGGLTSSSEISGSLKPQLALNIDVLNGLVSLKTGINIVTTLSANLDIGSASGCKSKTTPHISTGFRGNLGFFVGSNNFPILSFPSKTLAEVCLE